MDTKNLGLSEAIDMAIEAELKARKFYQDAAKKVSNPRGQNLLKQLADFEKNHYDKLNDLKKSLKKEGKFIEYKGTQFAPFKIRVKSEVDGVIETHKEDAVNIISLAINAEKKAYELYKKMADDTKDPQGKSMFLKLSEEETLHRRILSDEFYQLSNEGGVWTWGE